MRFLLILNTAWAMASVIDTFLTTISVAQMEFFEI